MERAMNEREMMLAVAKDQGWKDCVFRGLSGQDDWWGEHPSCTPPGSTGIFQGPLPNWPNSLPAMYQVEDGMTQTECEGFDMWIRRIVFRKADPDFPKITAKIFYWHASATQRCEAYLRVKGLWVEGP